MLFVFPAAAAVKGQSVSPRIDTGVRVIGKTDLDDAEVKKLLETR